MQREGSSRRGWAVLAVMLAVGLMIFAMSMMLERNRAQTALSATKEKLNQAHQQKTTDSGVQDALVLENEALYVALAGAEAERDAALSAQAATEAERDEALLSQAAAEAERDAALLAQTAAEAERDGALLAQSAAEAERDAALLSQAAAEAERDEALLAQAAAEAERDEALLAQTAAEAERDEALLAQSAAEAERDGAILEKTAAEEQLRAAQLPENARQPAAEFSVPVGMWVLEPYAFEVAEGYLSMQQDSEGSYHFYYDDQGSTLSCAVTWLDGYHDDAAVEEMYRETAASLQAELQLPAEAAVSEHVAVQGKTAMKTMLQLPDMELTVLQFCPDGVQTLVVLYADVNPADGTGNRVMQVLMDSVEYLPDRYQ